jgi:hypothetical protein
LEGKIVDGVPVKEGSLLIGVSVQIEIVEKTFGFLVVSDEMFHAVDGGLSVVADKIVPVKIVSACVESV